MYVSWRAFSIESESPLPLRSVELRLPLLVEPAAAEGIGESRQESHVLAPAGLAAEANAISLGGGIGDLRRGRLDEIPGRLLRHGEAGLGEEILAVHQHGALAVEGRGIELAVDGQA